MQLGVKSFRELLIKSPETDDTRPGLARCEARAVMAGQMAAKDVRHIDGDRPKTLTIFDCRY